MNATTHGEPLAAWFLDRKSLKALGLAHREAYRSARPFPHAVFDGFLGESRALALAQSFPGPEHSGWMRRDYREQAARMGQLQRTGFEGVEPALRHLLGELCGMAFLDFLGALSGSEGLIADPHFRAAVADFQAFCRETGHALLAFSEEAGVFSFVIRKKDAA